MIHCYAENQIFIPQDCAGKVVHSGRGAREGHVGQVQGGPLGSPQPVVLGPERAGGGVLLDMGCHSIEVTRHLFGANPEATSGWTATLGHKTTLEDNSLVLLRYPGGALGQCENSWTAERGPGRAPRGLRVRGVAVHRHDERDRIRVFTTASEEKTGYIVEKADAKAGWLYPAWNEFINNGYLAELRHFVGAIAAGKQPTENFEDGRLVNAMMESAYASAREGRWLPLKL